MQCLSSPTRENIDKARAQYRWLDIGVPSAYNLRSISRLRLLLWCSLALSSVSRHLLHNSTVISTRASQEYAIFVASPPLLNGTAVDWSMTIGLFKSLRYQPQSADSPLPDPPSLDQFRNISSWNQLSNDASIQAYAQSYISGYEDVIAIMSALNASKLRLLAREIMDFSLSGEDAREWICSASQPLQYDVQDLRVTAFSFDFE